MVRPTFIVGEPEAEQALSSRKLVLETAKFNVLTAHSPEELLECVQRFPKCDAVIVHSRLASGQIQNICEAVRKLIPDKKIVAISPSTGEVATADYQLDSHDPEQLVALLRELFGDPRVFSTS